MDNRHALIVDCKVTQATGTGERDATSRPGGSAIDGRTSGYAKSIHARRGTEKVSAVFGLHVVAYNLIRLGNLLKPAMAAP